MNCTKCGAVILKEDVVCKKCGTPQHTAQEHYGETFVRTRSRFVLLFWTWFGAAYGLHLNYLGFKEEAQACRKKYVPMLFGIIMVFNPMAWINFAIAAGVWQVENFAVLFGKYRQDASGRPVRYLSFLKNTSK